MKRNRKTWEKVSKNSYLSSDDIIVWKTQAFIPFLDMKFTKKQLTQLFRELTSALKKMKNYE